MENNDLIVAVNKVRLDAGLLILRVGAGLSLLVGFGWPKLEDAVLFAVSGHAWSFADTARSIGLPAPVIVACYQTLNESFGAVLVMCGLLSRWASASLGVGFLVATYIGIEMTANAAWIVAAAFYCLIFTTLTLTGPGQYSIDHLLDNRRRRAPGYNSGRGLSTSAST